MFALHAFREAAPLLSPSGVTLEKCFCLSSPPQQWNYLSTCGCMDETSKRWPSNSWSDQLEVIIISLFINLLFFHNTEEIMIPSALFCCWSGCWVKRVCGASAAGWTLPSMNNFPNFLFSEVLSSRSLILSHGILLITQPSMFTSSTRCHQLFIASLTHRDLMSN